MLLSSVGVVRRDEMPYPILNACGVLTAKASAEAAIKADAEQGGYAYTFVRPGQLFGGPYDNNVYLGTLFQLDKDADERDVLLGRGDVTLNDDPQLGTLRSTPVWKSTSASGGRGGRRDGFAKKLISTQVDAGRGHRPGPRDG